MKNRLAKIVLIEVKKCETVMVYVLLLFFKFVFHAEANYFDCIVAFTIALYELKYISIRSFIYA